MRPHRALSVPALLIALLAGLLAPLVTAPASHAKATNVSRDDGVLYDRCHNYGYRYSIDTSVSTEWEAETTLRGPGGKKVDTDYLHSGSDEASGTSTHLQCGGIDPAGPYKLTLEMTFFDEVGEVAGHDQAVDRFRLRKPRTRTSFTVDDRTPRFHQFLNFRVMSMIEGPKGYIPNRWDYVALEAKRPGGWKLIRGSKERVGGRGITKMKARWERRAPIAIRAVTLPDKGYDGSASKPKTLG